MSVSRICCVLVACILLTGCAHKTHGTVSPTGSADDWRDATYTITCDGVVPSGFRATLHDGTAKVPAEISDTPAYTSFDVRLEADATGDLDGDGKPDTVVLLQCHPEPSNGIVEEVQVFNADGHLIAGLPSPRTLQQAAILPPVYDPNGLTIENGQIVARMKVYEKGDFHAGGPHGRTTIRWRWDGRNFQRVE